ncbi:MAG: FAD-dependent monooxygenase [Holosporaceae bacterium]|nr:MAG: FAD-dependent monooxygenase [Holosporaceae bacterium]
MQEYSDLTPHRPYGVSPSKGCGHPTSPPTGWPFLGDAAHVIHPLAGQGFNLGIQDADVLSDVIAQGLSLGLDLGSRGLLQNYERQQRRRHLSLLGATDGLNRLFSNENAMLSWIRSTGLKAIESMPTIKTFFAEEGTGLARKTSLL